MPQLVRNDVSIARFENPKSMILTYMGDRDAMRMYFRIIGIIILRACTDD